MNADGHLMITMLLVPDVYPGRQIRVESVDLSGAFRVEKVTYSGDSAGQDWYIRAECIELFPRE
jgi:hypothetical protein